MIKFIYNLIAIVLLFTSISSCKKNQDDWLEVKASKSDVVPTTLAQFRGLLDENTTNFGTPVETMAATDNFYFRDQDLLLLQPFNQKEYTWEKEIFPDGTSYGWNSMYAKVFTANVVLDGLQKVEVTNLNEVEYNDVKANALYLRSNCFFELLQIFAKQYTAASESDPGIPLKLNSFVNEIVQRSSIGDSYRQIVNDLKEAETLIADYPANKIRSGKAAVQNLLARIYLVMGDYVNAGAYANKVLSFAGYSLLDFNTITRRPQGQGFLTFPAYNVIPGNSEVIRYHFSINIGRLNVGVGSVMMVDTNFYNSYHSDDLRKALFFQDYTVVPGAKNFTGSYSGGNGRFTGSALNEAYLIKAETQVRSGQFAQGMQTLNYLLQKRWKTGTFVPLTASTQSEALTIVLRERRKEFPQTSTIRWQDLRRLNLDPSTAISITRVVNGITYTLPPNDPRYVYPIPLEEIQLSGIQQNPR